MGGRGVAPEELKMAASGAERSGVVGRRPAVAVAWTSSQLTTSSEPETSVEGSRSSVRAALLCMGCRHSDAGRSSGGGGGVKRRVWRKVEEYRARFYIMRRCVCMLVCWREDDD